MFGFCGLVMVTIARTRLAAQHHRLAFGKASKKEMKPTLRNVTQQRALTAGGGIRKHAVASLLLAATLAWSAPSLAQTALPSVEVDLSVVDELAPAKPGAAADPILIQPPKALKAEQEAVKARSGTPGQTETGRGPASPAKPEAPGKPAAPAAADKSGAVKPATEQAAKVAAGTANDETIRLIFGQGSAELPGDVESKLGPLAERMKRDDTLRVQLLGYAASKGPDTRESRRLSLSRALAVRLYLTKQGVGGTRALVRPLGSKTEEEPLDRVDIVVVK